MKFHALVRNFKGIFCNILGKWVCSECVNDGVDIDDVEENSYVNVIDSTVKSTDSGKLLKVFLNLVNCSYGFKKRRRRSREQMTQ